MGGEKYLKINLNLYKIINLSIIVIKSLVLIIKN